MIITIPVTGGTTKKALVYQDILSLKTITAIGINVISTMGQRNKIVLYNNSIINPKYNLWQFFEREYIKQGVRLLIISLLVYYEDSCLL